jgi:2,3-bisphosphoglycerate-independent phosphoglycerate mutase
VVSFYKTRKGIWMKILFLFLDGVGLGPNDPDTNPLAQAEMANLFRLLGGRRLVAGSLPITTRQATLLALDACLGVKGLPQSATGQASLLTGLNVPAGTGYHYGPKPNQEVARYLAQSTLFSSLLDQDLRVDFLNAYPPRYFEAIQSRRRIYSSIPLAATNAGLRLKGASDLAAGVALSADFTAQGWRDHLGIEDAPLLSLNQAGRRLGELAQANDFSFFEYWLSDYAGHRQDMKEACQLLENFDQVLGGLLESWDPGEGLILITSDHGNLEDLSTRRHTYHPVPCLIIGEAGLRQGFIKDPELLQDITGIAPAIRRSLSNGSEAAA